MKKGIGPYGSGVQLEQFQADFLMFEPKTKRETIVTQQAYQVRNVLVETRRGRLGTVNSGMPSSLWALVILGGLITMTATLFFDTPSFRMHFWMTTLLSTLLGLMVFLVGTLDNPFRGNVSIGPASMQRVYDQLMVQHVFSEPAVRPRFVPCVRVCFSVSWPYLFAWWAYSYGYFKPTRSRACPSTQSRMTVTMPGSATSRSRTSTRVAAINTEHCPASNLQLPRWTVANDGSRPWADRPRPTAHALRSGILDPDPVQLGLLSFVSQKRNA